MAATIGGGLLAMSREGVALDARRTGKGLMRVETTVRRPAEGEILELQSKAGNAAVARSLQRETEAGPRGATLRELARGRSIQREVADAVDEPPVTAGPASDGILRYGSRGDDVRSLQTRLNALGARPSLAVDGIFGRKTQRAVRRFQGQHPPLEADGDAGPLTMAELDRVAPKPGESTAPDAGPTMSTPSPTGPDTDAAKVNELFELGKTHYLAERYGPAYDEFTKAWEINGDTHVLWNRAQALRLRGGRRAEVISLYEQFLATNADADEQRRSAREHIEELRGPGRSGDKSLDTAMVNSLHRSGQELYSAGSYLKAYDEFSKAFEITNDPALLWNRAQSLRLAGGRRSEAIALYEQFVASVEGATEAKGSAQTHIAELRGPGKSGDAARDQHEANHLFELGRDHYLAEEWALAYDEFSKAHEITGDPALLWNRAQAMRLIGGRREEAIALYEHFIASDAKADEQKNDARGHIAGLRGPGKRAPAGGEATQQPAR